MPGRRLELRWPVAGVVRRPAYAAASDARATAHGGSVPAYSSPWAVNCRPVDSLLSRLRGGSRPTLSYGAGTVAIVPVSVSGSTIQVHNPVTDALVTLTASSGSLPTGVTAGIVYRTRVLLYGGSNAVYASRAGDITDWDYSPTPTDNGRPGVFQLAESREIGETPTVLIPHKDQYLLGATAGSLWSIEGDVLGGRMQNRSRDIGCVGPTAWTKVGNDVLFLSDDGLYSVAANGEGLTALSRDKVPEELLDCASNALLAYNHVERGVYIFLPSEDYHWFYDFNFGGFWPFTTAIVPNQAAIIEDGLTMAASGTPVVVGGAEVITSHVLFGPIRLSSTMNTGQVVKLQGNMATGSADVTWSIIRGDTAELASERAVSAVGGDSSMVAATGTFSAGRSHVIHPRVRAPWIVLWLTSDDAWAYELISLELIDSGLWR